MHDEKKELTLKQVGEILKKSWLTVIVFVLVAVIVFGSVIAVVKTVATTNVYQSKISFSSGSGETKPWLTPGVLDYISSSENIGKALSDCGIPDEEVAKYVESIRENIYVTPIVPESAKNSETEYVPGSYLVTMNEIDGLTELGSVQVLSQIVNNFVVYYKSKYVDGGENKENAITDVSYDYVEIADKLYDKVNTMISNATQFSANESSFVSPSSNLSFSGFVSALKAVRNDIESFDSYIVMKGITKQTSYLSASEYIKFKVESSERYAKEYTGRVAAYKEVVDLVAQNGYFTGTVNDQTIIIEDNESYFKFMNDYNNLVAEEQAALNLAEYWKNKQTTFEAATEFENAADKTPYLTNADTRAKTLQDSVNQMVAVYNTMIDEYNEFVTGKDSVTVLVPAHVSSSSPISNTVMIIAVVLVALIAALLGFMQGRKKYLASLEAQCVEVNADQKAETAEEKQEEVKENK